VHPVLEPLRGWCLARGLGATVQVSDDLHADVATLVAGRTLGISQGTLGLSAGWLSPVLRTVYLPPGAHVRDLLDLGVRVLEADLPGTGEPWRASADQVAALAREAGSVPLRELSSS
jgi:hypothetical protein